MQLKSLLLILFLASPALSQHLVLINGTVVDGSGKPRIAANIRVRDGQIAEIARFKPLPGEMVVDVKGMIVAPGFIDLESLSPSGIQKDPAPVSLVAQGVTTAVLGSDGSGPYLVEEFMQPFDVEPAPLNIAMLVGHATVRRQIMGSDYQRAANADEIVRMGELVSEAMKQGAFGLGSDLRSEPASFSTREEVMALARIASMFGGTLVLRLRDENEKVTGSVQEAVNLARDAKIPVQVLTANKAAQGEIEKARARRIDIAADTYSFAQFTRDKGVTIERAIQRLSATPASRMGLRERGLLRKGAAADLVVFNPQSLSSGIRHVFVNGVMVIKDGQPTGERPGHALR